MKFTFYFTSLFLCVSPSRFYSISLEHTKSYVRKTVVKGPSAYSVAE